MNMKLSWNTEDVLNGVKSLTNKLIGSSGDTLESQLSNRINNDLKKSFNSRIPFTNPSVKVVNLKKDTCDIKVKNFGRKLDSGLEDKIKNVASNLGLKVLSIR